MPIDTHVLGDPGSVRASAQWLRAMAAAAHNSGTDIRKAGGQSESGWTGPAADAFRGLMAQAAPQVDGLSGNFEGAARAMEAHATDLDTVRARMDQARGVALAAGLPVTETTICEPPGPPPSAPAPLPKGRCPSTAEQQAFDAGNQAITDYAGKCAAYEECARTAAEARQTENDSQATLLGELKAKAQSWMTWADFASGAYATWLAGTRFRMEEALERLGPAADSAEMRAALVAANPAASQAARTSALLAKVDTGLANVLEKRRLHELFGGDLAKNQSRFAVFLRDTRFILTTTVGDLATPTSALNFAPKVVKSVPLLGLAVTTVFTGLDIAQDPTDPGHVTTSVVAGGGSLLAATAVAMAFPPTWVVTPIVLGGVTAFVVDAGIKWAAPYVGDAADHAKDAAGDLWNGAKDMAGDAVDGAKNKAKDAWNGAKGVFGL
ncbi:hypothetical protein AB0I53_04700 [Saccharopolyspora sp. NPDC050389]|uniref:WXG100 family type VII secretion target n=1 Tax=Saccharopolyspora sp. NPDC050389 TaxID=3155516 RepID=UPI0033F71038